MEKYLSWATETISDFSEQNINTMYNRGFVFTRIGHAVMQQTRSLRIDLAKFEPSSENRRILKKVENLDIKINTIPYIEYNWQIGKIAKDFYDTKFAKGVFSANKVKELLTNKEKSNFNYFITYSLENEMVGYAICYANSKILHYSYPFYGLSKNNTLNNIGMGMIIKAIQHSKEKKLKFFYLGSAQRPSDKYKLQFKGLEWFDGENWSEDLEKLKHALSS